ncbi:hypothetical protein [Vibrio campbellii]|uniref:hypothetical protein n=1 Tax=Vibrio campbellii TaxID=680 RepID=UPI000CD374B8|nr:hypothetical protein [Vibrio campbellii]AUW04391.1 hypothetical protein C1N51_12075 [Vibrio campbellii]
MVRYKRNGILIRKLLIEKGLDGFTVVELRNAIVKIDDSFVDMDDARRKVYRQILRFMDKGWLRSEGGGRKKRYFQTEIFKNLEKPMSSVNVNSNLVPDYSVLRNERNQFQAELKIVLGEIEGYQCLCERFPELEDKLVPFIVQARERSAFLLGQINVFTNALKVIFEGEQTC